MTRYHQALGVFLLSLLGLWGCARGSSSSSANSNDRIKALEAKTVKLEDDLKSTVVDNQQLRKKLGDCQDLQAHLRKEIDRLHLVVKERDELKVQLKTRTSERDQLQAKYEGFLRELDELSGRAKAALQSPRPAGAGVASGDEKRPALPGGS
jgi:chromosome segregation ATPase